MVIKRALISVSDKIGLETFGQFLSDYDVEIISTGGSAHILTQAGVAVTEVSSYTDFPEIMDGRVKTLHPKIHGGILGRRDLKNHVKEMTQHEIPTIDLVVVNFYPFEQIINADNNFKTCIENIDIGGFALVRAAAKNYEYVTVLTKPSEYQLVIDEMITNNGATSLDLRQHLAKTAFIHTAAYDTTISKWLENC